MDFSEYHEKGSKRFGVRWMVINQALAETANVNGINAVKNKLALTKMAWRICLLIEGWAPRKDPNEGILDRLIAEGEARNWQDTPDMITVAEALERGAGRKIGYRYTHQPTNRSIIFCSDCNEMYRGDYSGLNFEQELWSSADQWFRNQLCHRCRRTLQEASYGKDED